MSVRSGQSITVDFVTQRFDTGATTAADSTPTGTLVVNGTDDAASVTVTSKSGGKYKAAVTLPTLAIGDVVQLRIAATVNSVSGVGIVWTDTKDVLLDSSGKTTDSVQTGDSYAIVNSGTYGNAAIKTTADAAASYVDTEIGTILSNVTDILAAVDTEIGTILTRVDVAVSTRSVAGDAMTLTTGERTAIANEVEAQIIDDTDSERVLTAITDKIAAVNPSLDDLTLSAIASAIRTELATELARLDATVSSRATPAQVNEQADTAIADVGLTSTVTARIDQAVSAAKTLTSDYDAAKTAATQTSVADISSRIPAVLTGDGNLKADALKVNGQTPQTLPTIVSFSAG